jgi:hypothetical protein
MLGPLGSPGCGMLSPLLRDSLRGSQVGRGCCVGGAAAEAFSLSSGNIRSLPWLGLCLGFPGEHGVSGMMVPESREEIREW